MRERHLPSTGSGLVDIVRRFRRLRALVIGDAMLDAYLEGTASRLCREGPVPVVAKTGEEYGPGGAANSAANLRALGAQVDFLAVIGRDLSGDQLRAALHARDVDDALLVEDDAAGTHLKMRILADNQYVVRFDAGETKRLSAPAQAALLANLDAAFARCDLVVVSDYGYGVASDQLIGRLQELRRERPCPLIVDSKDPLRFRRARATLLTPNHHEARQAAGESDTGQLTVPAVERTGRRILALTNAEQVAITMAGDGVLLVDRQHALHVPAHPVARANDVGAGDSFTAAAALALTAGAAIEDAMRIGMEAGGIAVTKQRTAIVRQQELLQRVSLAGSSAPPSLTALTETLGHERRRGRTIVFTNGVFDILHAGHVHFLREARQLGDILVVAVNTDRSARLLKGANRPINRARDRMALVAALDPVDHVISFDEETPEALIRIIQPDIHVKGGDYAGEDLPEADAVRAAGGQVVILPLLEDLSTTTVIERITRLAAVREA